MTLGNKDIAIIGISIFCPAGESKDEFWHGISRGEDFITDAPEDIIEPMYFDGIGKEVDRFYCKRGGFTRDAFKVDPLRFGILPIMAEGVDPDQFMSMAGAEMALRDAGVYEKEISLQNGCIIIGKGNFSGLVTLRCTEIIRVAYEVTNMLKIALPGLTDEDLDKIRKAYQSKQGRWQPDMAIGTMPNLVASLVANRFDMHGPAYCVDAACASGIVAINQSIELLRSGQCDIAIAGGMHTAQSAMFISAFNLMGALSRRGIISPFSKHADGLLIGQGGGFIVLKTLEKAVQDEDRIYAVIKDTAVCSDGGGSHVTVTSVKGETRVMEKAWKRAGMNPDTIGLIEAHGTATPVGDRTEIAALAEFFGDNTHRRAYVGSVKSNIGHTMPSAGMIGVIKTALALYHRKIPPTLHCEEPTAAMYESRFLPPQEPMDWDGEKIPLVAGVNAFGFGGINSHAILTAYEPKPGISAAPRIKPYMGETLLVSALDQAALIQKLEIGDYTNTGGDYRIVIFDPDEKRIGQAISIVKKDKPWRGRLDIWFSNKPLLSAGGKIVYLFPGINFDQVSETDSISDSFGLPRIEETIAELEKQGEKNTFHLQNLRTNFIQSGSITGLEKLGVEADFYAGHSVGEWYATAYAGMTEGDLGDMREMMDSYIFSEDYPFIAVSGIDCETAEAWCAQIPGLYLTNDNCPSQVLLCGTPEAADTLLEQLEQEKIYYSVLPFSGGMHTPLISENLQRTMEFVKTLHVREGKVPVWSATTLKTIPANNEEYCELVANQLTQPVYFRQLIEKLYAEEDARVFVQIGLGALTGFVEDTLKDRAFSAVSASLTTRDGADQLRRVLAALFVEGKSVNSDFLGVKPMHQVDHNLLILPKSAPLMNELPELTEIIQKRYGAAGPGGALGFDSPPASAHPIHQAAAENLREAMKSQDELTRLFEQSGLVGAGALADGTDKAEIPRQTMSRRATAGSGPAPVVPIAKSVPPAQQGTAEQKETAERSFSEPLRLTLEECPYLLDHAVVRQPKDWPFKENLNAVVPLTMTIELLADIAQRQEPDRKLVQVRKISAYQWIPVPDVFEGTVNGVWKGPDQLDLELDGYARAEFYFADQWPEQPADYSGDIDIGEEIMEPISSEDLYDGYAFHGPQYQSSTKTLKLCAQGIANLTEQKGGKGSLLDIMGQQLGLFLHLTQEENTISFPTRLSELNFYEDYTDQKGVFEHTLRVTRLSDTTIVGDMVLKRDGRVWSLARNFVCQRFINDRPVWYVSLKPQYHKLAKELAPGIYYYSGADSRANIQAMMSKRYIDIEDGKRFMELEGRQQRSVLYSRIALKDAVRIHVAKGQDEMPYPVEIFLFHDENGKPFVRGHGALAEKVDGLHVSLAHKGDESVAMVAEHPVGIDIEKVEEKEESFLAAAFTEKERALLKKRNRPDDVIRFWVAKEACGKKAGTGLKGNPQSYEVQAVDGDILHVGTERVQTMKIGEQHIAGWTL